MRPPRAPSGLSRLRNARLEAAAAGDSYAADRATYDAAARRLLVAEGGHAAGPVRAARSVLRVEDRALPRPEGWVTTMSATNRRGSPRRRRPAGATRRRLMRSCRRDNRFAPRSAATRRSASVAALRSLRHGRRVSSLRAFPGATRRLETWDPASARWARRSMRGSERPSSRHPPGAPPRSGARGRARPASRNTRGRRPSQHCPRETP